MNVVAHPEAAHDYVRRARAMAKMAWDARGILAHLGNPVFLLIGVRANELALKEDLDLTGDMPRFGAWADDRHAQVPWEKRFETIGIELIGDMVRDVVPYSLAERNAMDEASKTTSGYGE